jgi:hypothetical protein
MQSDKRREKGKKHYNLEALTIFFRKQPLREAI